MRRKRLLVALLIAILSSALWVGQVAATRATMVAAGQKSTATPDFISPGQLKSILAANQAVTIIDVRDTPSYLSSGKIKGALYFKLRKLLYGITMTSLTDLPRARRAAAYFR